MRDQQRNREQYRWALWAVGLAAVGLAIAGYGCGDDGRGAGDSDGAAYPEPSYTAVTDARTVATDMDADHSAAWMEALDELGGDIGGSGGVSSGVVAVEAGQPVTPAPTVYVAPPPYAVLDTSVQLTEAQAREALTATGWPEELHPQALAVFCGIGNARFPSGESNCSPHAMGDGGNSLGFAQLNAATWAPYCGVTPEMLMDLHVNLACAYQVYLYDINRGYAPWSQWSIKPW